MKKALAIGALTVASIALFGCQQKPAQPQPTVQKETSTATIKITEGETQTSKASLEIKPADETETSKTTLEIKPAEGGTTEDKNQ